ncbi:MAG TPA: hypothetical protein VGS07_19705 [Thermoanaerobaculia bacterium]|jgi:hypothetical protein|nr:hypothetical protein [Thermoanaerobaculia bacterium]
MNPFRYSDNLHIRTQTPDRFNDYRRYKPFLREEFGRRCVYCCLPDGPKGEDTFGVDHYRPRFRFPELDCEYTNLFYACNLCNRRKGTFWADEGQQSQGKFIPNPCAVIMAQHLQYEGARVIALTPAGQLAAQVLDLNDPRDVLYREFVLRNIEHCLRELEVALKALRDLDDLLPQTEGSEREEMLEFRGHLHAKVTVAESDIERLTGTRLR